MVRILWNVITVAVFTTRVLSVTNEEFQAVTGRLATVEKHLADVLARGKQHFFNLK